MIFLDTCIWIELVAARGPVTEKEIRQATLASNLINEIGEKQEKIITCREQILEIISAIEKYKMREYNRNCSGTGTAKVGQLKEFRKTEAFGETQELCQQACDDVRHMAKTVEVAVDIDSILEKIHLVDINDCVYYDYCNKNGIDFYTFDGDFRNISSSEKIHILS